jgi:hypothetical protein
MKHWNRIGCFSRPHFDNPTVRPDVDVSCIVRTGQDFDRRNEFLRPVLLDQDRSRWRVTELIRKNASVRYLRTVQLGFLALSEIAARIMSGGNDPGISDDQCLETIRASQDGLDGCTRAWQDQEDGDFAD